jgi:class 3 adenylate cyclase/hemoglobin-like flavoprotein
LSVSKEIGKNKSPYPLRYPLARPLPLEGVRGSPFTEKIKTMPNITYYRNHQKPIVVEQEQGKTLLDAALQNHIAHYCVCGGHARCTTCRVYILKGKENLAPRTEAETKIAVDKNWSDNIRLACQTKVLGDVTVKPLVIDDIDMDLARKEGHLSKAPTEQSLVVMFCDIENYTGFSATHLHNPYDVIHLLNKYYKEIGEPIFSNRGYIDKYMGDGFMALFGSQDTYPTTNCLNAVRASLRMLARLQELNKYFSKQFCHEFNIRIGLHYGPLILGELGYPSNKQITVIGDTVNVASRIESANKEFGTRILASQAFLNPIADHLKIGQTVNTQLRGQTHCHTLYEIVGFKQFDTLFEIQSTYEKIIPHLDDFTDVFYQHFFELKPALKPLFNQTDLRIQKQMVIRMIEVVVQGINNLESFMTIIQGVYQRHHELPLEPKDYRIAGQALILALEQYLGDEFTPTIKQIWLDFYESIVATMMNFGLSEQLQLNEI